MTRTWHGRTSAEGGGWAVTIDRCADMNHAEWRALVDSRGQRFTHIGELRRSDGRAFDGDEAFRALDRVRLALNLALGRRTTCALPVGYRSGRPVWTRWRTAPVDPHRSPSHWLDETIAHQQVSQVLSLVLDFTADDANYTALKLGLSYYMAGNVDVDVELSVSIPISGLQLLAYYRFVTQQATYSRSAWKKLDTTEDEIQLLLDDINLDTSVRPYFAHFEAVRAHTVTSTKVSDALSAVMKMRNVVTHPTRDTPNAFDVYEWAEAGMHVRYWLCLALLNTVGYTGDIASALEGEPRWTGQVRQPPWVKSVP